MEDVLKLSGKMLVIDIAKPETLKQVLMRRDRLTAAEAQDAIDEAADLVREGADPEEVLAEEFGLEPDFVFDLLEAV